MSNAPLTGSPSQPKSRSRLNIVWSGIDFAVAPIAMLIATPILIHYLGLEQFGVLVLINALISFSAVFNFGFGDTALKYVSHHITRGQTSNATEIVRTIGLLALGSGVAIAVIFALLSPVLVQVLNIDALPYARDALLVAAFIMPLRMVESVYIATLRGCYRYDLAGYITAPVKLANIASQAGLAIWGHNLPIILLATACIGIASGILLFCFCWQSFGNILPRFHRRAFDDIRQFAKWSWLQGISGMIYSNIDRLMVAAVLGPAALGVYGVCMQLAQQIHMGLAALAHALFPRISMLSSTRTPDAPGEANSLRTLYMTASRTLSVTAVLVGSMLAIFSYEVLEIWVGQDIALKGSIPLALLAISFSWFAANSITTYYTLNGLGKARLQAGVSMAGALFMLIGCVVLIPLFGLPGASVTRMPDSLFRLGVRMHLGSTIIGGIKKWFALDFLRITIISLTAGYFFKKLLELWFGAEHILSNFLAVLILLVFSAAMFAILQKIEQWFGVVSVEDKPEAGGSPSE